LVKHFSDSRAEKAHFPPEQEHANPTEVGVWLTRLRRRPVRASPGMPKLCPHPPSPPAGATGPPRGPSPVRPPLCSPSTIGRPSDERFSARSPVPTERSFRQPNRQAHPERLAGPCAEPKRSLGRVFGDTARDSWRAASPLPSARSPSDGEVSQLAESSSFSPRSPFSCDSESVMRQRQGRSATSARPGG